MFTQFQNQDLLHEYKRKLQAVGLLSRLFTKSEIPYLPYRIAENLFCNVFRATNHSRSDSSADAAVGDLGFGIKTFISESDLSLQKIAEFDRSGPALRTLQGNSGILIRELGHLRNERIRSTMQIHGLNKIIYHLVIKRESRYLIVEEPMDFIQLDNLEIIRESRRSVIFSDQINDYNFNFSKSTLLKKFNVSKPVLSVDISICENPFDLLLELLENQQNIIPLKKVEIDYVILPLYSSQGEIHVPEHSGLNQWNAGGRDRHPREVYIPIPSFIHHEFAGFFPPRDVDFSLKLPKNIILSAKVCQDGNKALMSNPNKELGKWLLGDVLNLEENELVTYKMLENIGIDSVMVTKIDENKYELDFKRLGTYEDFKESVVVDDLD